MTVRQWSSARPRVLALAVGALLFGSSLASAQQNPLAGSWRQSGWKPCHPLAVLRPENVDWNLEELVFKADGTYTVTWAPFETYKDYWGHYTYAVAGHGATPPPDQGPDIQARVLVSGPWFTGPIELVIEHGNFIPPDFAGKGTFAVRGKQLTLSNVKLGTRHASQPLDICEMTFVRD